MITWGSIILYDVPTISTELLNESHWSIVVTTAASIFKGRVRVHNVLTSYVGQRRLHFELRGHSCDYLIHVRWPLPRIMKVCIAVNHASLLTLRFSSYPCNLPFLFAFDCGKRILSIGSSLRLRATVYPRHTVPAPVAKDHDSACFRKN